MFIKTYYIRQTPVINMSMQKIPVGTTLAIALTAIVISALAAGLLSTYQRIPNDGNVTAIGVGVYWDSACTNNVTTMSWGLLQAGEVYSQTVYIQNKGSTSLTLNMTTSNWNPASASNFITLTWNREGYVLNTTVPVIQTLLTLSVSSNISGIQEFTFDITITGIEIA
jgi:hypothetical protein